MAIKRDYIVMCYPSSGNEYLADYGYPFDKIFKNKSEAKAAIIKDIRESISEFYDEDEVKRLFAESGDLRIYDDEAYVNLENYDAYYVIHKIEEYIKSPNEMSPEKWVKQTLKENKLQNKTDNGMYPNEFLKGFYEIRCGSSIMADTLLCMGLPDDKIPFDVIAFLQTGKTEWIDAHGNKSKFSFKTDEDMVAYSAEYDGKKYETEFIGLEVDDYFIKATSKKILSKDIGYAFGSAFEEIFPYDRYPNPLYDDDEQ